MKYDIHNKTPVEIISSLLAELPDTFTESRARRDRIDAASKAFTSDTDPLAASISETIRLLRVRADELRQSIAGQADKDDSPAPDGPAISQETPPVDDEAEHVPTAAMEAFPADSGTTRPLDETVSGEPQRSAEATPEQTVPIPRPAPDQPAAFTPGSSRDARSADEDAYAYERAESARTIQRWQEREKLLYRDIIHLFELGDHAGAMASLERLLMLAPAAEELSAFLGKNEKTLLRLYRDHLGSMDRVTMPARARRHVRIPTPDADLMLKIIRLSDGHRPIREFIRKLEASELHVLIVISHLTRSGYLELA